MIIQQQMEEGVPLLNLEQIEELTTMVRSIQGQNCRRLEQILSDSVEIEQTSILSLYNLVTEEWLKKQKVIDNLCYFTLTMMNTVQILWEQRFESQDRLNNAEGIIENLSRDIADMGNENEGYRSKVREAELQLVSVVGEKDRIEELYKSASCIGFQEGEWADVKQLGKVCSACSEVQIKMEEGGLAKQESVRLIEEKEEQLIEVLEEKKRLVEENACLREEHELAKMQLQLAEIAVKEALTYKSSYISMMGSLNQSRVSEVRSKGKGQFGDGFEQGLDQEEICPLNSHILLAHDLPLEEDLLYIHSVCDEVREGREQNLEESSESSLIRLEAKQDKTTSHQSPFKKKNNNSQKQGNNKSQKQGNNEQSDIFAQDSNLYLQNKGSVIVLQSSIDLSLSSNQQQQSTISVTETPNVGLNRSIKLEPRARPLDDRSMQSDIWRQADVRMQADSKKLMKKGQVKMKKQGKCGEMSGVKVKESCENGLSKLYSLISNKLITNRIKTK